MSWRPGSLAVRAHHARELQLQSWRRALFWRQVFSRLRRFST